MEFFMVDAQDFKQVMSRWTTGISVITTAHEDDWRGFTANSFASVSISPLLISMSVAKTLGTLDIIRASEAFAVNILTVEQADLGQRFAGMLPEFKENRFDGLNVTLSDNGNPLLPDTLGWMDCRVYQQIDVGASVLFLGEVTSAGWHESDDDTPAPVPLAYFMRQWGQFTPQPE
jgi:flavin reductase (DIM6/NTAB) family NADH-FMN oxidoreductase RutF